MQILNEALLDQPLPSSSIYQRKVSNDKGTDISSQPINLDKLQRHSLDSAIEHDYGSGGVTISQKHLEDIDKEGPIQLVHLILSSQGEFDTSEHADLIKKYADVKIQHLKVDGPNSDHEVKYHFGRVTPRELFPATLELNRTTAGALAKA